jgi:molecular chaperone GrpE
MEDKKTKKQTDEKIDEQDVECNCKGHGECNEEKCECEEVENQIDEKTKEIEAWKNKYLRSLADYQNLENRIEKQFEQYKIRANKNLILKMLEVLDMFDKAEMFVKDEGLKIIKTNFEKALFSEGLKELDVLNKKFDPNTAECIEVVPGKKEDIVVEVLRRGYILNEDIVRVAQVKVENNQKL